MGRQSKATEVALAVHLPHPKCGSSDALSVYEDHTYCFSCGRYEKVDGKKYLTNDENYGKISLSNTYRDTLGNTLSVLTKDNYNDNNNRSSLRDTLSNTLGDSSRLTTNYVTETIAHRGLTKETMKFFGIHYRVDPSTKEPVAAVFECGEGEAKVRRLDRKLFFWEGKGSNRLPLFGMDKFPAGCAKAVTITEGEYDAASVYQMMGSKYPSVSVTNGSSGAAKNCSDAFKYLNSFELIYICFDNDAPGTSAAKEVAELFDVNKVRIVNLDGKYKDANEYLQEGKDQAFNKCWWGSKQYLPSGVISTFEDIRTVLSGQRTDSIAHYPFPTLDEMAYGIRTKEVVLFTAQEGIGKTEVFRAIEHKVLKETDHNIAIVHIEEEDKRSVQGLISYELGYPCHLPDYSASVDEQLEAYSKLVKRDGRVFYYSHFGTDDADAILDVIRYLVVSCNCKLVFLDHITMMVTGLREEDERRLLDYVSTRLAMMVHQHDFALVMISHINDDGKTRGSRNISKVAHLHVQLDRDKLAETLEARNTTKLTVHKNRFGYKTGDAGYLLFDPHTFQIKEKNLEDATSQSVSPF